MLALARLIRCAIVASGTRNAARDLGRLQAAHGAQSQRDLRRGRQGGWQHMKSRTSVSSVPSPAGGAGRLLFGGAGLLAPPRAAAAAARARRTSAATATWISQPRGLSGRP